MRDTLCIVNEIDRGRARKAVGWLDLQVMQGGYTAPTWSRVDTTCWGWQLSTTFTVNQNRNRKRINIFKKMHHSKRAGTALDKDG